MGIPTMDQLGTFTALLLVSQATIAVLLTLFCIVMKAWFGDAWLDRWFDTAAILVAVIVPLVWAMIYAYLNALPPEGYTNMVILAVFVSLAGMGAYGLLKKAGLKDVVDRILPIVGVKSTT